MKSTKRSLALLLSIIITTGLFVGCGNGGNAAKPADTVSDIQFPLEETVTLKFLTHAPSFAPQNPNETLIMQRIEAETNVHIDWTCFVDDQFIEKKQLTLARKALPDVVFDARMSQYDMLRYAKDGTIIHVEELIEAYMPNLKTVLDENPEYRSLLTAPDGHIYSFPWIEELGTGKEAIQAIGGKPWINQTWLTELGLPMPTTTDELESVLLAFKEQKPGGRDDIIPLSFMLKGKDNPNENVAILLSSFGYGENPDHYVVTNDKKVIYTLADSGIKPGFEWLHNLYKQGLIDPEAFTQDWGTYAAKGNSGRYGVCIGWAAADIATKDDYVPLPPLAGPDGNVNITRNNSMGFEAGRCVITSSNKNLELTAKYIDKMYDPIQSVQNNWGTYGASGDNIFELTTENTLKHLPIPDGVSAYELRYKTNLAGPLAVLDSYYGKYTTRPDDATELMNIVKDIYAPAMQCDYNYPPVFPDMDAQNRITQLETDLKPYAERKKSEWIMNGGVEAEWDAYIQELQKMGLDELLSLKQQWLDSYFDNM